jgi:arylsulfatase A-like enzyme
VHRRVAAKLWAHGRSRWRAPALAALLVAAACGGAEKPPNLLVVVLDTTRADAVGVNGGGQPAHTPVLDELARTGVWFPAARTVSAWTLPSHATLFTGLYPSRHGAHWESPLLAEDRQTLAEVLAPDYDTAGFSENPHIVRAKGFAQGFARYEETWRLRRSWSEPPPTLALVADWFQRRDRARPFFAFVNLMTPHLPYTPPPKHEARFLADGVTADAARPYHQVGEREARLFMSRAIQYSPRDFEILRMLYRAEVSFADEQVGRILEMLRTDGELERTLVVVVGDHGENIGDHGLMEHQLCLYESLLRVPLILRLPGALDGGVRRDAPVQLVDVMPTALAALGVPEARRPRMEGLDLTAGDPPADRPLFAEYFRPGEQRRLFASVNPGFDFTPYWRRLKSVQVGALKLIASERGERELYDLVADPGELHDLSAERPGDVKALDARLAAFAPNWAPGAASGSPVDEETRRALRELGYVE